MSIWGRVAVSYSEKTLTKIKQPKRADKEAILRSAVSRKAKILEMLEKSDKKPSKYETVKKWGRQCVVQTNKLSIINNVFSVFFFCCFEVFSKF